MNKKINQFINTSYATLFNNKSDQFFSKSALLLNYCCHVSYLYNG